VLSDGIEVDESELRWRRSSHAAIAALLPSHSAFHSDTGLTLTRNLRKTTAAQRKTTAAQRRKSVAVMKGI